MAKKGVLQIAKAGTDLNDGDPRERALDTLMFLPKVYAVKKLVPIIAPGDVWGYGEYIHGLGYPPMFLFYIQQKNFMGHEALESFNPPRFSYGSQGSYFPMDSTKFVTFPGYPPDLPPYLILFLDPLSTPASSPAPTTYNSPRFKIGNNLLVDSDYKADLDSKYQTLKVHMQGQLVYNLPQWTADDIFGNSTRVDWFTVTHNLGYPPVHTPFINNIGLDLVNAFEGNIPTDFIVNDANDGWAKRWPYFYTQEAYSEGIYLYVDTTKYYVGYRRQNNDWGNSHTFPARTVRVNYTIFNLAINQEFDLLA